MLQNFLPSLNVLQFLFKIIKKHLKSYFFVFIFIKDKSDFNAFNKIVNIILFPFSNNSTIVFILP